MEMFSCKSRPASGGPQMRSSKKSCFDHEQAASPSLRPWHWPKKLRRLYSHHSTEEDATEGNTKTMANRFFQNSRHLALFMPQAFPRFS
jgi:hypothetical protein